jgi:hypothetical protein
LEVQVNTSFDRHDFTVAISMYLEFALNELWSSPTR